MQKHHIPKFALFFQTTTYDPTLDDSIEFAKRLNNLKVPVSLDVISSVQHGFLNFVGVGCCNFYGILF